METNSPKPPDEGQTAVLRSGDWLGIRGRKLTLQERYPNNKPRLLNPFLLAKEGKAISCLGPLHSGTCYGDLREIWTIDGNGVNELHMIGVDAVPNK